MVRVTNPLALVILNEVKNLAPRVLVWDSAEGRICARDEILRYAQNDMDVRAALPHISTWLQL